MLFAMPSIKKLCKTLGTGYAKILRPAEAGAKRRKAMQMARKAMQGIGKWPEKLCRA
jgi:hypothetical protein